MPTNATLRVNLNATVQGDADLGTVQHALTLETSNTLAAGTAANQFDRMFTDTRTLADAGTEDIDLTTVVDQLNQPLGAAELVGAFILNSPASGAANTTALTIGGSANDYPGVPDQTIPAGGMVVHFAAGADGLGPVADSSTDIIRVTNGAGAANTYRIVLLARSA